MNTNPEDDLMANTDKVLREAAEKLGKANHVAHGHALVGMILRGVDALMDIEPGSVEELMKSRMDLNYARIQGHEKKIEKRQERHTRAVLAFESAVQKNLRNEP